MIVIESITLTRGLTATPGQENTLPIPTESVKSLPGCEQRLENSGGDLSAGRFDLVIDIAQVPTLHDCAGGFLAGWRQGEIILCHIATTNGQDDQTGRLIGVKRAAGGLWLQMQFSSGVAIWDDVITDAVSDAFAPYIGRSLEYLVRAIWALTAGGELTFAPPSLVADDPYWSYAEHPERRWALSTLAPAPTTRVKAMCWTGSEVIVATEDYLLGYSPATRTWREIWWLHDIAAITNWETRDVTEMRYSAGTLTMAVRRGWVANLYGANAPSGWGQVEIVSITI
jgi:hypothetical protein